jgi:hypothetical protein
MGADGEHTSSRFSKYPGGLGAAPPRRTKQSARRVAWAPPAAGETMGSAHRVPALMTLPRWPVSTTIRARARQLPSWSYERGVIWAMLSKVTCSNGYQVIRSALLRSSSFGVLRESQGLETRPMLGPCFKQCSSTASGNAQALPQAMLKHAEGLPCTYGEQEQTMHWRPHRYWGRSPVQSLIAKSVADHGSAGSGKLP